MVSGRIGKLMVPGKAGEGQWKDRDTDGSREAGEGQWKDRETDGSREGWRGSMEGQGN